jgi:predicted HTH domain antitoxin
LLVQIQQGLLTINQEETMPQTKLKLEDAIDTISSGTNSLVKAAEQLEELARSLRATAELVDKLVP